MHEDQADLLRQRLIGALEIAHEQFQRREATAWLVMSYDAEMLEEFGNEAVVGCYGPFATPEEALLQAGKHDSSSLEGFKNVIVPLYPPVEWKD